MSRYIYFILCFISILHTSCSSDKKTVNATKETTAPKPKANSIPMLVFNAFKKNNKSTIDQLVMTEQLYDKLPEANDQSMTSAEKEILIKSASERAKKQIAFSFDTISNLLRDNGFDWQTAELISIKTVERKGIETFHVKYDESNTDTRIDLFLTIESKNKRILIKIDDCFLIEKQRYIGDGFKLIKMQNKSQ